MEVSTKDLHVRLSGAEILKGIDLKADAGRFVGIIGPNGSGKSTLLKCIYRVLKPEKGAVFLDGELLSTFSVKESAKKVGVVAQHSNAGFDFTVYEMAMMGRAPHKRALEHDTSEDHQIVNEALRTVGMQDFVERSFATLSGGEQQRVILARALVQRTPCLILDEPTNHLDIKYQLQFMQIVKRSGHTVISAIHDLNIAAKYCDTLYVLQDGRIRAYGAPDDILTEELIEEVYGVRTTIMHNAGSLHIIFRECG